MVWGAMVLAVSLDLHGRRPADVKRELQGLVPDEKTAFEAIEVIRAAEQYDRVTSALRYLRELKRIHEGLKP